MNFNRLTVNIFFAILFAGGGGGGSGYREMGAGPGMLKPVPAPLSCLEKKKKTWHEQMTAGLKENDKILRVCVRLLDESSIYIFH